MAMFFEPRRDILGKRALITGASSGIGRSLAIELASRGAHCLLVARNETKLNETAERARESGATIETVVGDVTDPEIRRRAVQRTCETLGGLDLLVNNAGVGAYGRFVEADASRLREVFEINLFAAAEMIRIATPHLREGADPAIVNIGSILGERGLPYSSEYCASKFALHGLHESIQPELAKLGVEMLLVAPGATKTEFADNVVDDQGTPPWGRSGGVSPDEVAQRTADALERRKRRIIPNRAGWWMVNANRVAPWLVDRVMQKYG